MCICVCAYRYDRQNPTKLFFSTFRYLIVSFSRELACLSSSQCFNGNAQTYINKNVKYSNLRKYVACMHSRKWNRCKVSIWNAS